MIKTIVVAIAKNHAIGKDNDLLWRLPDDFKFFKQVTTGKHIIMGRRTYESMPNPLPNRTSVVITRNKNYEVPKGHYVVHSLAEALEICTDKNLEEAMIIGGGKIYTEAIENGLVDKMLITEVDTTIEEADTFFPFYKEENWEELERVHHSTDEKHKFAFDFVTYLKKI
ncbi:MAG: diacylglycerol kinase [Cytophagales bacterium CG12_big_fil_rev_8_21_14_0_65_40_12]|nr:MAG: diacylglycerol kinase [Cytophagales bacterium CG12_big_fil_rev_8_21_14_0_65_40_12]PIW03735.1 MAG: diacylglycerol kinase [Cytophagales bacterium CG17_big_fil_post_rev_8_21_14_2_50_40_13]